MDSIKVAKKELRDTMKRLLYQMKDEDRHFQSLKVQNHLVNSKIYQKARTISTFLSLPHEINTYSILENIFLSNKTCMIPFIYEKRLHMVQLNSMEEYEALSRDRFGIKSFEVNEALQKITAFNHCIDLVLVPGLAFDTSKHRLGYGMGYYDRFLGQKKDITTTSQILVALCFDSQIIENVPTESHDVKLDHIITPNGFI
ncbi:5-formyltetrahydrofolate cyclo-ligase [Rozella allomycis CSF55]|uniref:5-formyltetrahydrofolate cyclo-ligase n=1 Tax=Rozella allomycis (strain CSF55) TaxID=988480 RepID=A0A4P9YMJ2_ROZAC|nr:5-formyltetrahydrofolate cyclo-ligase [Rozella allomycis CSF55]